MVLSIRISTRRLTTLAALALASVVGVSSVATASGATGVDQQLLDEAVQALKTERNLTAAAPKPPRKVPETLQEQIKIADQQGALLLDQLVGQGFKPSEIVLRTLGHLPTPGESGAPRPTRDVYDVAIRELGGDPGLPPAPNQSTDSSGSSTSTSTSTSNSNSSTNGWTGSMAALAIGAAALSAIAAVTVVVILRRRKDKRLEALAMTDSLTALHNRRRLDDDMAACSSKHGQRVGVLMVDVDNFKLVNDLQGHAAGDRVLQFVGAVLAQQIRPKDVAYRYGGEEFCVLLPGATEVDAYGVAERIRQATSALRIPGMDPVTVSVGVAIGNSSDVQHTLQRADAAMYDAKRDGRDRVALAAVGAGASGL